MSSKGFVKKIFSFRKSIKKRKFSSFVLLLAILISYFLGALSYYFINRTFQNLPVERTINLSKVQSKVLPDKGYKIKITWKDLGKRMIEDGVIDEKKLAQALSGTDTLPPQFTRYLDGSANYEIIVDRDTASFWVDILWGLGLANKNPILEEGPMTENGNAANFASTGGWTLGAQDAMNYYSKFPYITLSPDKQKIVKEIADNVYRPCCGNPTSFPDCNHGMAALALIELLVAQGKKESEIYKSILAFNSYWFPETYLDIAYHFEKNGINYSSVPASKILSKGFSSAMGYQTIKRQIGQVNWSTLGGGGSCGA